MPHRRALKRQIHGQDDIAAGIPVLTIKLTNHAANGIHFELLPGPVSAVEFAARLRCATLRDHDEIARVLGVSDPERIGGCSDSEHVYTQTPSQSSRRDYDNHPLTFAALDALVVR